MDPKRLEAYLKSTSLVYKTRSNSYIFTCPRCIKKDKLYIRRSDGYFCCFVCRETTRFKGKPEYALSELLGLPVSVIKDKLYDSVPFKNEPTVYLDLNLKDFLDPEEKLEEYIPPINWPWNFYPLDDIKCVRGQDYLLKRGISLDIALSYGIRYCPQRRRIGFPVNLDGILVGYQERLVTPNKLWVEQKEEFISIPKILSSEDLPRDHLLMFSHRVITDQVILCEGPIDAIKGHLCPGQGNVVTMGKAVSKGQIEYLLKSGINKIYLALDPDALDETARLVRDHFSGMECYLMLAPKPYKDLGDMPMEEVVDLYRSAPKVHRATLFAFLG